MIWLIIILLVGLLSWQVLERAYVGPAGFASRLGRVRNIILVLLLVAFSLLVLWQLYLILRPA